MASTTSTSITVADARHLVAVSAARLAATISATVWVIGDIAVRHGTATTYACIAAFTAFYVIVAATVTMVPRRELLLGVASDAVVAGCVLAAGVRGGALWMLFLHYLLTYYRVAYVRHVTS